MYQLTPIGVVRSGRNETLDDDWDAVPAVIELDAAFASEALLGLEAYSHAEIFYVFDRVPDDKIERGARHPRGNTAWPRVGIFAQRAKNRPNRLGATVVRILGRDERTLRVAGLDAVDGTPVVDIKPVMREFLPRGEVRQPAWATELMADYWQRGAGASADTAPPARIASVTLLVREYDEAIAYYTGALGFALLEDTRVDDTKRWVRVAPAGGAGTELLLARAADATQAQRVGDQAGGRVFLFLRVADFDRAYTAMKSRGVQFAEAPRSEAYGHVAVFVDLYGNRWDLLGP